jgi:isoquinoline 1-oxidoreductase beta subunit
MSSAETLSRRGFLKVTSTVAGLVIALSCAPAGAPRAASSRPPKDGDFEPNAYIRIARNGTVTVILDKDEVGQGVATSLPMLLAEELEVGLGQIVVQPAPPDDKKYADPILRFQATGNSTSVRANWQRLREAGAACRMMLISAAAAQWKAQPADCKAESGRVIHQPSGRSVHYGELVDAASRLPVPEKVTLKKVSEFKLIGKSPLRLDLPSKVNGQAQYGIDIRLPGMKFASVKACPVFGGTLRNVNDDKARAVPGFQAIVRLPDAVAVIADNTWAAFQGLAALQIEWAEGPHATTSQADIVRGLETAAKGSGILAHQEGNLAQAQNQAAHWITARYEAPFLAHAPMEPVNCVVHVRDGACDLWTSTQVQARAQAAAAQAAGVPQDKVTLHNLIAGGAFGRRLETDFISQAAAIARQVDGPVKVTWSREEDVQRDMYRPYYLDQISAGLDARGTITGWRHRIVGSSVMARFAPPALGPNGLDPDAVDCASQPIYQFPNYLVDYVRCEPPGVPTAFWRGVGPTHNIFVMESFIDECAATAKQDPVAYRKAMLKHSPRALRTLEVAASKAGWGEKLPDRTGRGVAVVYVFDTYLTVIAEAAVGPGGDVRIRRVVCAVDCGTVVHPDGAISQIEGGVLFGLSAALFSEITIEGGRTRQSNFNNYRTLRMSETPPIEVHLVPSGDAPGGLGETGTIGAAPALTNAIFAATGVRIRKLPIRGNNLAKAAI